MIALWFHGECYTIPLGWDVFQAAGWTLTRYERDSCWVARRPGFRKERIAA